MNRSFCGLCRFRIGRFKDESQCHHPINIRVDSDWYGGTIYGNCKEINKNMDCAHFEWKNV